MYADFSPTVTFHDASTTRNSWKKKIFFLTAEPLLPAFPSFNEQLNKQTNNFNKQAQNVQ